MKPIITEMNELSDSKEVYESKPMPVIVWTIYSIFFAFIIAGIWMYFFRIDVVVKSAGQFRAANEATDVSANITGEILSIDVSDGEYVKQGQKLMQVKIDSNLIKRRNEIEDRLIILKAYQKMLDGDSSAMDKMSDNPFYQDFLDRKELLEKSIEENKTTVGSQQKSYQTSIEDINTTIAEYNQKISDLTEMKNCIASRTNIFADDKAYYKSLIDSYISKYILIEGQYNAKINEYETKIFEAEKMGEDVEALRGQLLSVEQEKNQALSNMETEQLAAIETQIDTVKGNIRTLNSSLVSASGQLDVLNATDVKTKKDIKILTEKEAASAEILELESRLDDYDKYVENYDKESGSCYIVAKHEGYFYQASALMKGDYLQEGNSVGVIFPSNDGNFYAQIYVLNSDIGKIKEGQSVKMDIKAYPSDEYGFFYGTVSSIAKDITVDSDTGMAYYIVRVECKDVFVTNKKGEKSGLQNGMACQAKIITDEETILQHILREIDVLD